jgi:hypothetical protein
VAVYDLVLELMSDSVVRGVLEVSKVVGVSSGSAFVALRRLYQDGLLLRSLGVSVFVTVEWSSRNRLQVRDYRYVLRNGDGDGGVVDGVAFGSPKRETLFRNGFTNS